MAATNGCGWCWVLYIKKVNHIGKLAVCLAGGLAFNAGLRADDLAGTSANPYAPIVDRNVFGLLPPPTVDPNAAAEAQESDLPKITANGIMDVFGNLKVLFTTTAKRPKPGEKPNYYDLAAGEAEDGIEVVSIDQKDQTVTFMNNGFSQDIALVEEPTSGGGGNGSGGGPGGFGGGRSFGRGPGGFGNGGQFDRGFNPRNGGGGYGSSNNGYNGGGYNDGNNGYNNGGYNGGINNGGFNNGANDANGLTFGNGAKTVGTPPNLPQYPSTPEEQAIAIAAQQAAGADPTTGRTLPPWPPTALTPPPAP
jgi:hypothetical protein